MSRTFLHSIPSTSPQNYDQITIWLHPWSTIKLQYDYTPEVSCTLEMLLFI